MAVSVNQRPERLLALLRGIPLLIFLVCVALTIVGLVQSKPSG
jgi:hypothetical protein